MTAAEVLATLSGVATSAAPLLPPEARGIVGAVGAALDLVARLVAAGRDPVAEITRIVDLDADLRAVESRWSAAIAAKPESPPGPTLPGVE